LNSREPAIIEDPVAEEPLGMTVLLNADNLVSSKASLRPLMRGGVRLKTDPANGGYTATLPLPPIDGPFSVRIEATLEEGAIGAVVTEALDANAWVSEEKSLTRPGRSTLVIPVADSEEARALLLRNLSEFGASSVIISSIDAVQRD
jgi:hypothetical protein